MLKLFAKRQKRIEVKNDSIFIHNQNGSIGTAIEIEAIFNFKKPIPEIKVYENENLIHTYKIETLSNNPNLTGQFLHSSIRILENSGVMIDGIISKSSSTFPEWKDEDYEAIRFQPFFLSDKNEENVKLKGKGLFDRGLHFSGTITPMGVRNICLCDNCNLSFTIQHFHAGFSQIQYFYSTDSQETLIVPYTAIENLPFQLQENVDDENLEIIEAILPIPSNGKGTFNYYNSFRCPHCLGPFIDFENNKEIRMKEYYGNSYINQELKKWNR